MTLSPACAADSADTADHCTYCATDNPAVVEVHWSRSESAPDVLTDSWRAGDCCREQVEQLGEEDYWRVGKVRVDPIDPTLTAAELESRARAVADTHTVRQVRAQLAVLGPFPADPAETQVWRRALALLDLCDEPQAHAIAASLRRFPDLLDVLAAVDDGRLSWSSTAAGGDGAWVDAGDETRRQVCGQAVTDAVVDLRHDGLVEPHVAATTGTGWAVRRVVARGVLGGAA